MVLPDQNLLMQDIGLGEGRELATLQTPPSFPGPTREPENGAEAGRRGPDPGHPVSMTRDDL